MKKILVTTIALGLSTLLMASANVPLDKEAMRAKVAKIAGATSPFNPQENFPKEYFLIPRNLPFALGIVLHHPQSSTLGLSKVQITQLVEMKQSKKPAIVKMAKEIKAMELQLLDMLESGEGSQTKVSEAMEQLVDKIAHQKATLTKAHLQCVIDVQNALTKEQRAKVSEYILPKTH